MRRIIRVCVRLAMCKKFGRLGFLGLGCLCPGFRVLAFRVFGVHRFCERHISPEISAPCPLSMPPNSKTRLLSQATSAASLIGGKISSVGTGATRPHHLGFGVPL